MGKLLKISVLLIVILAVSCGGKKEKKHKDSERRSGTAAYKPREYKFPQKYIDIDGVKISYIEAGQGDKTVVFIHGVGGSLNNWEYNIEYFASRFHVLALDLPGHGNSERPDIDYSVKLHAKFLYKFLQAKNIEKPILIGHSMGGQAAVLLQLDFPCEIEKLVLVAPSGADVYATSGLNWLGSRQYVRRTTQALSLLGRQPYPIYKRVSWAVLERDAKRGFATAMVYDAQSYPTKEFLEGEMEYYYDFLASPEYPGYANALKKTGASIPRQFIRRDLGKITAPSLIVWGKYDGIVPFENASLFNDLMPTAMMAIIPDAAHLPMVEKPERFNRVVMEFVQ